jgi:hypothetical protein
MYLVIKHIEYREAVIGEDKFAPDEPQKEASLLSGTYIIYVYGGSDVLIFIQRTDKESKTKIMNLITQ